MLELGADSLADAIHELRYIADKLERENFDPALAKIERIMGGVNTGYHLTIADDPEMDHDRYVEALNVYLGLPRATDHAFCLNQKRRLK